MAGEHLRRTHTSTGSKKKFTYSLWFKSNIKFTSNSYFFGLGGDGSSYDDSRLYVSGGNSNALSYTANDAGVSGVITDDAIRDYGNWYHFMVVVDTTIAHENDRVKLYINGVRKDVSYSTTAAQNANISHNTAGEILLLGSYNGTANFTAEGLYSDIFNVDGQALTPDVFGFYKDGDGYISAGATQATDFRPGQWSPRAPKSIKYTINRSGGFGVNGFYLPMNDSSNPGADFHCDPNSIIKLKGEDLPQPRNGAPTTSDAYVSQLRSDPFAANLVLAVPGISTATGANLISNGTFDTNISGWTATDNTQSWDNGQLQINRSGGGGATSYQAITTVVGERYTVVGTVNSAGSRGDIRVYDGTGFGGTTLLVLSGTSGEITTLTGSFTASSTTSTVGMSVDTNSTTIYVDNIVVKQEDAPRDYSADIKGSGTNKVVQATLGTGGVGYELGGYYGSAINANDSNCGYAFSGADSAFVCPGDFTVEFWFDPVVATQPQGNPRILGQTDNSGGKWDIYIDSNTSTNQIYIMGGSVPLTGGNGVGFGNFVPGQWNHFCLERSGSIMTTYMNGVAVYSQTYTNTIGTTDFLYLGSYGDQSNAPGFGITGKIQDFRFYKGVAKYKGGFDVPKPYTPVGIEAFRTTTDTCKNNFATWNPVYPGFSENAVFSNGNLTISDPTSGTSQGTGTIGPSSGKWYYEARAESVTGASHMIGIRAAEWNSANGQNSLNYRSDGSVYNYSSAATSQASYTNGDIIGIAFDPTDGRLWFSKNGVWTDGDPSTGSGQNVNYTPSATTAFFAFDNVPGTQTWDTNFGQNPSFSGQVTAGTFTDDSGKGLFKYAPPTGFLALCEDNLPTPAIKNPGEHFKSVLYTGDGNNGRSITGVGFKPDLVWIKGRSGAGDHGIWDSVRGGSLRLISNKTDAEASNSGIISLSNDGFSLGNTGYNYSDGVSPASYVAWCWRAGGEAVTNTDGSITSQVSVNQDAGFSIVSYTGTGTGSPNIGHGLNKKPSFIIVKERFSPIPSISSWQVYHSSLGATQRIQLNLTNTADTVSNVWNDTEPTSDVFYVGGSGAVNEVNSTFIAYCWAEIEGYSKFGSYVGNGNADGPFVYCGFKPAFLLLKIASPAGQERDWHIYDSARNPTNIVGLNLRPSTNTTEINEPGIDFLSNGFKIRENYVFSNYSGGTIIFVAFAESPFQTANAK